MGIIIDVILIAILILNIFLGYKKGLVNAIFSIFAFLIAIVATAILYKPVSNIVINNTGIYDTINETIVKNITGEKNDNQENGEKTNLQKYIENQIDKTKEEATEMVADTISMKAVQIITAIVLFIVIRIILALLKFLIEGIAELPIIKQFNQAGGIIYGIIKAIIIILLLLTIMYFVVSINGNGIIADMIDNSYLTKFLYDNNIIVNYCLLGKNLL